MVGEGGDAVERQKVMKSIFLISTFWMVVFAACDTTGRVAVVSNEPGLTGACDSFNVYQLYNAREGQVQAVPPLTLDSITKLLQTSSAFAKSNPEYKGIVAIHCYINCTGELIKSVTWGKWGDPKLREEVIAIFRSLKTWTPGKLYGKNTDCVEDFRVELNRGIFSVSSANIY